jgi:hypothetical protein
MLLPRTAFSLGATSRPAKPEARLSPVVAAVRRTRRAVTEEDADEDTASTQSGLTADQKVTQLLFSLPAKSH